MCCTVICTQHAHTQTEYCKISALQFGVYLYMWAIQFTHRISDLYLTDHELLPDDLVAEKNAGLVLHRVMW